MTAVVAPSQTAESSGRVFRYRTSSAAEADIDTNLKVDNYEDAVRRLDEYYGKVKRQFLLNQSVTTGLFPETSTENTVGDVRTSVYCALAIWSLYQAYRRIDDDRGKAYELGQSCVKSMRGILTCWMHQADKVEKFKQGQQSKYALHSKFHLVTGNEIYPSELYGHLQIDIISLYIIALVQMITSGLQIIYTMDEVTFVQNLVYYVERAYRTPDFGMWERGSKYNNGTPELHASSIGMAKAALEAINGCNLFGEKGASWSVIFVDIDAHNRNRSIFETLLPRESSSKDVDASLLFTISFPVFATHDQRLYKKTKDDITRTLSGKYGFKRFLRDGYGTVLEDKKRPRYYDGETKEFENIECEWPIFFICMIIEGIFKSDEEQVQKYYARLKPMLKIDRFGDPVVPKFYYIPKGSILDEKDDPHSQPRQASSEGTPRNLFLWGQSMFLIATLLFEKLLHINELDLIRRYLPSYNRPKKGGRYSAFQRSGRIISKEGTASDLVVQVVLIAESMRLQAMMATYGIQTQTPHEVEPVQIWSPKELVKIYQNLGVSTKLGLHGRPPRPIGALGTSKIYRISGQTVICYPLVFEVSNFYLSHDMSLLIDNIKTELHFVGKYWRLSGRPTVCLLIREEHMRDTQFPEFLDLLAMLKTGHCNGLKVRIGRLQNLLSSSCIEHLDFMTTLNISISITPFEQLQHASVGYQSLTDVPKAIIYAEENTNLRHMEHSPTHEIVNTLKAVTSLQAQTHLFNILARREGLELVIDGVSVKERIEALLQVACSRRHWAVVRECTALLSKEVESLSPFITTILVSGKMLTIGLNEEEIVIDKPVQPREIHDLFYRPLFKAEEVVRAVLQQEVVLYCGKLIGTHPHLFQGILNIRVRWMLRAMDYYHQTICKKDNTVESLAPSEVSHLVHKLLSLDDWANKEKLIYQQIRMIDGCLGKAPSQFFEKVFAILCKTPSIRIGDKVLYQNPTISEMSKNELNFAVEVQALFVGIEDPEYRQIVCELFCIIATILHRNKELRFIHELNIMQLVQESYKIYLKDYDKEWSDNMSAFYNIPSVSLVSYLARAVVNCMLSGDIESEIDETQYACNVS